MEQAGFEKPVYRDPYYPVLKTQVSALELTPEQDELISQVISVAASDTRFAQKAYTAIKLILQGGVQVESTEENETEDGKKKKKV